MSKEIINKIDVKFLMRRSCKMCRDIIDNISNYMNENDLINFNIIDLDNKNIDFARKHSSITPALWVEGKMWYAGGFEIENFDLKLKDLLKNKRRLS